MAGLRQLPLLESHRTGYTRVPPGLFGHVCVHFWALPCGLLSRCVCRQLGPTACIVWCCSCAARMCRLATDVPARRVGAAQDRGARDRFFGTPGTAPPQLRSDACLGRSQPRLGLASEANDAACIGERMVSGAHAQCRDVGLGAVEPGPKLPARARDSMNTHGRVDSWRPLRRPMPFAFLVSSDTVVGRLEVKIDGLFVRAASGAEGCH